MIGKPNWFDIRKYSGWGLRPKAWQGWLYLLTLIVPLIVLQVIPHIDSKVRLCFTAIWLLFLMIETIDIVIKIKRDERERVHEAIAERNAAWFITLFLALALSYQAAQSALIGQILVDPIIALALVGGTLIKLFSHLYLKDK